MSSPSTNPSSCDSSGAFPSTCAGTASTSVDSPSINPNPYTPNAQFQSVSQDAASSPAMARSVPPHQEPHYPESSEPFVYFTTDMANKAAEAYELEKFDSLVEWYHRNRDRHNFPRISFPNAEEPPVPHNNIQEEEQANVDRRPLKRKNEDSPPSSVPKQPRSEEEGECSSSSKKTYLNIGEIEEKEQEGKENPLKRMELMTNSTVFNAPCEVSNSETSVTTEVKIEEIKTVKTETVDKSEEIPGPIPPATDLHQDFLRHQQLLQQQQQHHQQMMEQQRSQMAGQMPMGSMFPSGHPGVPHPSFSPGYPGMPPMMPFMGQPVNPPTSKSKSSKSKPSPNPMAAFRMPPFPPNHPMFMQQQMQMNMMRQNMMHAGRSPSFGMYPMGPVPGPPFPGGMPSHPQQFPYPMMGGPMSGPMHGPMNGPMSGPLPGYMGPPSNMLQAPNSAPPPTENNARNSPFMSPSPSSLTPQQLPAGNNNGGMLVVSGGTSSSDQSWPSFYGNPNPLPGFPSTSNESAPNAPSLQQLT